MSNDEIKLRSYQEQQVKFLKENKAEICGIQSPTGTGKSIMILSYIKEYIRDHYGHTVILTTGFNNLVFQMKDDAKNMGINTQILIGASYLDPNCKYNDKITTFGYGKISNSICKNCPMIKYRKVKGRVVCDDERPDNCSRKMVANFIDQPHNGTLIITNHSYYLTMKDRIKCDLLIVDEAHTFSDFYSSYQTFRMTKDMRMLVDSYCDNVYTPTSFIMKSQINNSNMSTRLIENAIKEMVSEKVLDKERAEAYCTQMVNLYKKDENSFVENDPQSGEVVKYNFYHKYDIPCNNIILMSATLDDYTKKMFGLNNRNQIYIQKEPLNRYSDSYYLPIADDFINVFGDIMNYIENSEFNNGLILCNTMENVAWVMENFKNFTTKFDLFSSLEQYKKCNVSNDKKGKILIGSKRFFQGVNIPDLDFVILDKLPFATYDSRFRSYEFYLKKNTNCDPWMDYTLPLVKNSILQACGRLWRHNDYENRIFDNGIFILTDTRLDKRFKSLKDFILKSKPGIRMVNLR